MHSEDSVLLAVLVALVVLMAWRCRPASEKFDPGQCRASLAAGAATGESFSPGAPGVPAYPPRARLQNELDMLKGARLDDGYGQIPLDRRPGGLDRYHRSCADLDISQLARAEQEQWFSAESAHETFDAHGGPTELPGGAEDCGGYSDYVTDIVTDPRTRENHQKWVDEMRPWAGTAKTVDNFDVEPYLDFRGLRRPEAVVQHNPQQLTEVDSRDLLPNRGFHFNK